MSRSSTDDRGSGGDYLEGWRALHRLVRQGNSLNGHERNTCFLNLGSGPFADVSAVSGFDHADDGRALAVTDWDQDGRLDLWTTNRTGPRVRFLRNAVSSGNAHVALRLQGRRVNRDGIGARVEVHAGSRPLVRTLAAGSGFLSQSSKWLHFGLGGADAVEQVVVHWPGGGREAYAGVRPGGRYLLVEGSGRAREVPARAGRVELEPAQVEPPPASERTRTVLAARLELPDVPYRTLDGEPASMRSFAGSHLLLNLWAIWCKSCVVELTELAERADELRAAGLEVLTLGTDDVEYRYHARRALGRIGWPYEAGWTVAETLPLLEAVQMAVLESHGDVVLPTSLLIDPEGRLVALYKGRVDVDRLLEDVRLPESPEAARRAATAFEGRWTSEPEPSLRFYLAGLLVEHGLAEGAAEVLAGRTSLDRPIAAHGELALGRALLDEGRLVDAEATLRRVLRTTPDHALAHLWLARALRAQNRFPEAVRHYDEASTLAPDDPRALEELGHLHLADGRDEDALRCFREAMERGAEVGDLVDRLEE